MSLPQWYAKLQNPQAESIIPCLHVDPIRLSNTADANTGSKWTLTQGWIEAMTKNKKKEKSGSDDDLPTPQLIHHVILTLLDHTYRTKRNQMQFMYVYSTTQLNDEDLNTIKLRSETIFDRTQCGITIK